MPCANAEINEETQQIKVGGFFCIIAVHVKCVCSDTVFFLCTKRDCCGDYKHNYTISISEFLHFKDE